MSGEATTYPTFLVDDPDGCIDECAYVEAADRTAEEALAFVLGDPGLWEAEFYPRMTLVDNGEVWLAPDDPESCDPDSYWHPAEPNADGAIRFYRLELSDEVPS